MWSSRQVTHFQCRYIDVETYLSNWVCAWSDVYDVGPIMTGRLHAWFQRGVASVADRGSFNSMVHPTVCTLTCSTKVSMVHPTVCTLTCSTKVSMVALLCVLNLLYQGINGTPYCVYSNLLYQGINGTPYCVYSNLLYQGINGTPYCVYSNLLYQGINGTLVQQARETNL